MTDPIHRAARALEESGVIEWLERQPKHHVVQCNDCGWQYTCLLEEEARFAGQVHNEIEDGCERIEYVPVKGLLDEVKNAE